MGHAGFCYTSPMFFWGGPMSNGIYFITRYFFPQVIEMGFGLIIGQLL